jgi:ATP-binding cassette, subfamily C (CFTR/MRP), member 1
MNASSRILAVLNEEELLPYVESVPDPENLADVIVLNNASFAWSTMDSSNGLTATSLTEYDPLPPEDLENSASAQKALSPDRSTDTLRSLSLRISQGQLVAVVGPVGCGKSTFLNSLLGELFCTSGTVRVCGSVSYHAQQPWILNATIKENILFGLPYEEEKLAAVLAAAALGPDLEVLPVGLETEIGERGINLSGGQKARVSFARALYKEADITLLDDPLSAVDAHTV